MSYTILNYDLLDALRTLPDSTFDGVLCDPPYELGFLAKAWDSSGVAFRAETWVELLRVCKPGAALLAFGGTRTYHRLACAIEDARWELRDCIMWVYGSGFPKSLNLEGEWDGYGTALKPAYEPCILARKPLEGTVAQNVTKWGCGALWIDGGRIGTGGDKSVGGNSGQKRPTGFLHGGGIKVSGITDYTKGRWPANLIHDGSPEVLAGFPESAGQKGDVRGTEPSRIGGKGTVCYGIFKGQRPVAMARSDLGSASRFFYCAKASQSERNAGCGSLPVRHFAQGNQAKAELARGNIDHAGNSGFNTVKAVRNHHPCVKPLDLCRYLVTLILPPTRRPHGPRKLLVPFSGSGSEMIGALMAGWDDVTGIEREAEYVEIAQARLAHWTNTPQGYSPEESDLNMVQQRNPWAALPLLAGEEGA